jgi:hypothetical protein
MDSSDRTASLMTPAKLAQVGAARAPVSPSTWLDRMAADVGHQHVHRLLEVHKTLLAGARASQAAAVQPALEHLLPLLKAIDFDLLNQRGWLAGLTGKTRNAGAEFAAQYARAEDAAQTLAGSATAAARAQQPHAAAADKVLLEFDVEYKALDQIIDQGARWLQDMRNQLKARTAIDAESQRQIDEDTARCELLVGRLKALRAAATASQEAHQAVRMTAQRRTALAQGLQQALAAEAKVWHERLEGVASAAALGKIEAEPAPLKALNTALRRRLKQVLADCEQLRTDEADLLRKLDAMAEQLGAAS